MQPSTIVLGTNWRRNAFLRWLLALGLIAMLAAIFTALAEDVWFQEGFWWDPPIILAVHSLSRPWLDTLMRWVTQLGSAGAVITAAAMFLWFLGQRRTLDAATVAISCAGGLVLNLVLKAVFARPRPALFTPLVTQGGFSFPSGHVAMSVATYGLLAVYLWRSGHRLLAFAAGAIVPLVAFSRIYLGVHYPSDTLASMAYATLWLWALVWIRTRHAHTSAAPPAPRPNVL